MITLRELYADPGIRDAALLKCAREYLAQGQYKQAIQALRRLDTTTDDTTKYEARTLYARAVNAY